MTNNKLTHGMCEVSDVDLLHGAAAIAGFLGVNERRAFHLLETGELRRAFKWGGRWTMRKSSCIADIEEREKSVAPAA